MEAKNTRELTQMYLEMWQEGLITENEFDGRMREIFLLPIFESLSRGEKWMSFGSCCCPSHPPAQTFECEITLEPHGFTIKPVIKP